MRGTKPRGRQPILFSPLECDCVRLTVLRAGGGGAVHQAQCLLEPTRGGCGGRDRISRGAAATPLLQSRTQQSCTRAGMVKYPRGGVCSDCVLCRLPGFELADGRGDGAGSCGQFRDQQRDDSARFSQESGNVQITLTQRLFKKSLSKDVILTLASAR